MRAWVLLLVLLLGGCASGGEPTVTVKVLVLDGNLRRLGDPCNGAGPFDYAHAEAGYVIRDRGGTEVFRGALPNGTAEKIMDVDFRAGMRQPTMCVMTLHVTGFTRPDGHELIIDHRAGLPVGADGEVRVS